MANFQMTFIFNAQRQGWSELFYVAKDSHGEAVATATAVGAKRKALLGSGTTLEAIRVSDVDLFNDSLVDFFLGLTPDPSTALLVRDNPSNAWLVRAQAGTQYRRSVWLRGLPDAWISFTPATFLPVIDPLLQANFNAWATKVVAEGLRMRALDKSGSTPEKGITELALDVPTGTIIVTAPNHGYVALDRVRIRKATGTNAKQVNSLWTVFATTLNTFTIHPATGKIFLGPIMYAGGGVVRKQTFIYPQLTALGLIRPAKKDTGRAFFVPRGRRRVVRT